MHELLAHTLFVEAQSAVADAYVRGSDWKKLRSFVEGQTWADWDYLRRAFRARALERLDEGELGKQEWRDGLAAARGRRDSNQCLDRLARAAIGWGWNQRAEEVMWIMAGSPNCPRWVLDGLWALCVERSETEQLQKLASLLALADPKSTVFRNSYAFLSLLAHVDDGNPHREAERLFSENPGNATIALTRALSLCLQGKADEALTVMNGLKAEDLRHPQVAFYFAIVLTATGDTEKAAEFLPLAKSWRLLPEEKALLDRVKLAATKAAAEAAQQPAVSR